LQGEVVEEVVEEVVVVEMEVVVEVMVQALNLNQLDLIVQGFVL
jgi:hypothetical protein